MEDLFARARALGFDKPEKYAAIERERRWLCEGVPDLPILDTLGVSDLYVDGARLRLRAMKSLPDGPTVYKFAKKADLDPDRRIITTIYLSEPEYRLLCDLPGRRLEKTRYRMDLGGSDITVDVFQGSLSGLILAEREFATDEAMAAYPAPAFTVREVTDDDRYSGGALAQRGRP